MKTKGQQLLDKPELLAFCVLCGGVAERLNASGLHPADGAQNIVRGSESLPHRQISNNTPAEALTSTGAKTAQPRPYESLNLSMRLSAVKLNRKSYLIQDEPGGGGCFAYKMSLKGGSVMLGFDDQSEPQTGD
jgi:hypothetical protein